MDQTPRWRRALLFALPSFSAAALGSVATGAIEGLASGFDALESVAAAGFLSIALVPAGLTAAICVRLLWRWWQPNELWAMAEEDGGGAPRVAGWITYVMLAVWGLAAAAFNSVLLLSLKTQAKAVVALASALIIVVVASVLVGASRPAARGLAHLYRRLDRRALGKRKHAITTRRNVVTATTLSLIGLLALAWFVTFRPRIGHLEIGFLLYLAAFAVAVLLAHQVGPAQKRARRAIAAAAVIALAVAGAAASHVRRSAQYSMLEIWAGSRLAGAAIDGLWDIQTLRSDFRLEEFRPREKPDAKHPDVVLITIDTMRATRTPPYGGPAAMNALKNFARKSVMFERAFSPGNVTRRSVPSIVLGLSPFRIRGRVAGWALRLDPRHVLVAERFRSAGYDTAGFLLPGSQFWPEHKLGLIRGLDHLEVRARDGRQQTRRAVEFLQSRRKSKPKKPLFLWIHYIDPHHWANDPRYGTGRTKKRYDAALTKVDELLEQVFQVLAPQMNQTIIAVTSDHGEELGDRGHFYHSSTLYNDQIRVPLIIKAPGAKPEQIPGPVGLVDVAPTLLDLAGFVPPGMPQMDGVSLAPQIMGQTELPVDQGEAYSVMVADRSVPQDLFALVAGRYKLITDGAERNELYDIFSDPQEKKDIAGKKPEIVRRLRLRLAARRKIDRIPAF